MLQRYPEPLLVPNRLEEYWSIEFWDDSNKNHHRIRIFNVIDDINLQAFDIDIAVSLSADKVTRYLVKLATNTMVTH